MKDFLNFSNKFLSESVIEASRNVSGQSITGKQKLTRIHSDFVLFIFFN